MLWMYETICHTTYHSITWAVNVLHKNIYEQPHYTGVFGNKVLRRIHLYVEHMHIVVKINRASYL